jgi:tetratricopeptide (TPR) repeat protein
MIFVSKLRAIVDSRHPARDSTTLCTPWLILTCGIFLIFANGISYAQQPAGQAWWYTLEQGKLYFRNGSYGDALIAFEDARRSRLARFTRLEEDFIFLLSVPEVRRLGDSLEFVEWYIDERRETAAAAALNELYYRVPKETINGSVARALKELDRLKSYPEAEYWLGETYRAEGELNLALRQYEKAWNERGLLETPGFEMEILYKITDMYRIQGNYQEMEKRAKEIIEGTGTNGVARDSLWAGSSQSSSNQIRSAMARIMENEGINRFLTLYRHNNTDTEKAHRLLGFFYYSSSRYTQAMEHLMFAFLIQNSVLIEEVIRRDYDYSFSTLENLMIFAQRRPELAAFMEETEYYRTVYYFATALYASGKTRPASQLWAFLAGSNNAGEWGNRAKRNPSPYIERPLERF